ncbi:MAG: TetR/AcrR family transcriptional regulator [Deferribacteres bacterium]|nr:TetR/AcrR family transcriptional regulator [candidate division KSB1 bacterium]MCB9501125.1 TetR/AcrR family transcriptional regulator [Deferribacteres bacterium]
MGIAERKEREKEQKRNDIVDAAERLFFSNGFANTTMDEVAKEAEFSKGTLYLYFKSKEDLYLAITTRALNLLEHTFRSAIAKGRTGLEKVRSIGESYIGFATEYPDYFNAMVYYESNDVDLKDSEGNAQACEIQGMKTLQVVAEAIMIGMQDGSIRDDLDPMLVATVLWGNSTGMITITTLKGEHLTEQHGMNIDDVIATSFEMTMRALKK